MQQVQLGQRPARPNAAKAQARAAARRPGRERRTHPAAVGARGWRALRAAVRQPAQVGLAAPARLRTAPRRKLPAAAPGVQAQPQPLRRAQGCVGLLLAPKHATPGTLCNPAWLANAVCTRATHRHNGIQVRPYAAPGPPPAPCAHPRQARAGGGRRARRRRRRRQAQQQRGHERAGVARGAAREEAVLQQVLGGRAVRRVGHQALRQHVAQLLRARGARGMSAAY